MYRIDFQVDVQRLLAGDPGTEDLTLAPLRHDLRAYDTAACRVGHLLLVTGDTSTAIADVVVQLIREAFPRLFKDASVAMTSHPDRDSEGVTLVVSLYPDRDPDSAP